MIKVSIIGAASYAGGELIRLLLAHKDVEIVHLTGNTYAGQDICAVFPYLQGGIRHEIIALTEENRAQIIAGSDLLFLIMPHGQASGMAKAIWDAGKKAIDIGADFRFADAGVYEQWYKVKHQSPELLPEAVYGLPELYRKQIAGARLVGNPGCYPTASILGAYPLLREGLIRDNSVIIDAKSGVSGAGRTPSSGNIYAAATQNMKAYGVAGHRHTPEIERILSDISGKPQVINFTPHLTPMARGIHSTIYADLRRSVSGQELTELYKNVYAGEPFVRVHDHGCWPESKWSSGSNLCHIAVTADKRTGRVIVCSTIDNLLKGAAGQAVQNMNLMCGFAENTALPLTPVYP
ncbi:MAG: N-acetyl-gamma-glutamyl-phosphate reductase [Firmicutes bacterium]|nr:N-acetyl-gamma-glutamyl-phosphate reductase [Bacillota bacterium]